jgi:hypothetical protein
VGEDALREVIFKPGGGVEVGLERPAAAGGIVRKGTSGFEVGHSPPSSALMKGGSSKRAPHLPRLVSWAGEEGLPQITVFEL